MRNSRRYNLSFIPCHFIRSPSRLRAISVISVPDLALADCARVLKIQNGGNKTLNRSTSSPGVPLVMRCKSGPLARSNDIPVLNGYVNTIDWDQNQSDLSDMTLGMRHSDGKSVNRGLPELDLARGRDPRADQKDRGLWERECKPMWGLPVSRWRRRARSTRNWRERRLGTRQSSRRSVKACLHGRTVPRLTGLPA